MCKWKWSADLQLPKVRYENLQVQSPDFDRFCKSYVSEASLPKNEHFLARNMKPLEKYRSLKNEICCCQSSSSTTNVLGRRLRIFFRQSTTTRLFSLGMIVPILRIVPRSIKWTKATFKGWSWAVASLKEVGRGPIHRFNQAELIASQALKHRNWFESSAKKMCWPLPIHCWMTQCERMSRISKLTR